MVAFGMAASMPILPSASITRSRRRWYIAHSASISDCGPVNASMAASWTAVNTPESMLLFTVPSALIAGALPHANATRQPVMLYALLEEKSSMATSLAPGRCRKLGAR